MPGRSSKLGSEPWHTTDPDCTRENLAAEWIEWKSEMKLGLHEHIRSENNIASRIRPSLSEPSAEIDCHHVDG